MRTRGRKRRLWGLIYSPHPFLLSIISLFLLLFVFVGSAYQIPAPFRPQSGEEARRLHLSFIQSLHLSCFSHALLLLTFENKSFEFEFQSERGRERFRTTRRRGGRGGGARSFGR